MNRSSGASNSRVQLRQSPEHDTGYIRQRGHVPADKARIIVADDGWEVGDGLDVVGDMMMDAEVSKDFRKGDMTDAEYLEDGESVSISIFSDF